MATQPVLEAVRPSNQPELVLLLFAEVLARPRLELAAGALVTELSERFRFDRVSLGISDGTELRILGCSHGVEICEGSETYRLLTAAMNEAMEQAVSLSAPVAEHGADWVTLSHEALQRREGGVVATIPVAAEAELIGAITFERAAPGLIGASELAELEHILGLVAPALRLMRRNERTAWQWFRDSLRDWIRLVRAQDSRRLRAGLGALALAVIALLVIPVRQRVDAPARVEGEVQRALVAPTDSYLESARVRPGDRVHAGQVLAELMDKDLVLERDRWSSELAQHETGYATAMARSDRAQAAVHLAEESEAQSQLDLVEQQIARASIVAPFDGIVIQGDLSQAVGAPVRQGDTLFTIAPAGRFRVIVEVDERDIAAVEVGQAGSLALSALPWDTLPITVTRITPLATPVAQRNIFEVEAQLRDPPVGLRPGLRGNAKIYVLRRPLAFTWAASLAARVRWYAWPWLP